MQPKACENCRLDPRSLHIFNIPWLAADNVSELWCVGGGAFAGLLYDKVFLEDVQPAEAEDRDEDELDKVPIWEKNNTVWNFVLQFSISNAPVGCLDVLLWAMTPHASRHVLKHCRKPAWYVLVLVVGPRLSHND
jgi:hypothetical protein